MLHIDHFTLQTPKISLSGSQDLHGKIYIDVGVGGGGGEEGGGGVGGG